MGLARTFAPMLLVAIIALIQLAILMSAAPDLPRLARTFRGPRSSPSGGKSAYQEAARRRAPVAAVARIIPQLEGMRAWGSLPESLGARTGRMARGVGSPAGRAG